MRDDNGNDSGTSSDVRFSRLTDLRKSMAQGSADNQSSIWSEMEQRVDEEQAALLPFGQLNPADELQQDKDVPQKLKMLYDQAVDYLNCCYESIRTGASFSLAEGLDIIDQIVTISPDKDSLFIIALHKDYRSHYIANHPVNVAILAIKLCESLGFERQRLVELGIAALLHDIGVVRIPDEIIYKNGALSKKELGIFKQRPNYSYEILQAFKTDHPYLAQTAIQIHERIDGSGYPHGIQQDEIHDYAQIIGLVDVYEALIHSRPQRERFLHFSAIKEIIRTCKHKFQHRYLKALLNIFSIFPLYSFVELNSGAIGRVIMTHPEQPLRPKLRIYYDSQKSRLLTERIVDLPEHPLLYIVDSINEEDIRQKASMQQH